MPAGIKVAEPYYALTGLTYPHVGCAEADVPVQQHDHGEHAPIGMAETGRHLAILGSVAAALDTDRQPRYYLARTVTLAWGALPESDLRQAVGRAVSQPTDRRAAHATGSLSGPEGPFVLMDAFYDVLTERVFERLFHHAYDPDTPDPDGNPHTHSLPLQHLTVGPSETSATVQARPQDCAGHFPNFPVLPVAVLGGAMVAVALQALTATPGQEAAVWVPARAHVHARRLVAAGTPVTVTASRPRTAGSLYAAAVTATAPHGLAATAEFHFTRHPKQQGDES